MDGITLLVWILDYLKVYSLYLDRGRGCTFTMSQGLDLYLANTDAGVIGMGMCLCLPVGTTIFRFLSFTFLSARYEKKQSLPPDGRSRGLSTDSLPRWRGMRDQKTGLHDTCTYSLRKRKEKEMTRLRSMSLCVHRLLRACSGA